VLVFFASCSDETIAEDILPESFSGNDLVLNSSSSLSSSSPLPSSPSPSSSSLVEGFYFDEEKFMSEWDIWKSQDIKNYSFTLEGKLPYWYYTKAIPMYGYEAEIAVKNGIMNSFEYVGEAPHNERGDKSILEPEYTSISDMYQKIYETIKSCERDWEERLNKPNNGCFVSKRYDIKYDPKFHYIISYKPITGVASGCIMDTTEHEVTVSDFSID
jgi:hypothetical protein